MELILTKILIYLLIFIKYTIGWSLPKENLEDLTHIKCKEPGVFALTFDDGPYPGRTDFVLDVLKENNVTATFFICGQTYSDLNLPEAQQLIRRTVNEGHQVGIHTLNHVYLADPWRKIEEINNEIMWVANKLEDLTGNKIPIMRPPYGAYNDTLLEILTEDMGLEVIMWNINTLDWSHPGDTQASINNYIKDMEGSDVSRDSFIALHHDPLPGSADLARAAIAHMKSWGYRFVTISECIGI